METPGEGPDVGFLERLAWEVDWGVCRLVGESVGWVFCEVARYWIMVTNWCTTRNNDMFTCCDTDSLITSKFTWRGGVLWRVVLAGRYDVLLWLVDGSCVVVVVVVVRKIAVVVIMTATAAAAATTAVADLGGDLLAFILLQDIRSQTH